MARYLLFYNELDVICEEKLNEFWQFSLTINNYYIRNHWVLQKLTEEILWSKSLLKNNVAASLSLLCLIYDRLLETTGKCVSFFTITTDVF